MEHVDKRYRKSSYSGAANTADCVEVAAAFDGAYVRDSKDPNGRELHFSPDAWRAFGRRVVRPRG